MIWRAAALSIAGLHVAYVAFVVFGSLLVLAWPQLMPAHLAAVAWAGMTMIFDFGCPLTPWEKSFWRRAGTEPYEEGFLQHHVLRTRFDPTHARRNHITLGLVVIAINAGSYYLILS